MNRWLRWGQGLSLLGALGCGDDARQRTLEIDPGPGADAQGQPDGAPLDAAGLVDAGLVDAGLVDAGLVDAGLVDMQVAACEVTVQRVDDTEPVPPVACVVAPADVAPCEALARCLCAQAPEVPADECHWAVAEPRALENLSDWCNGVRSMADLLGRESWLMGAPAKFELAWTPGCADVPASF